MFLSRLTLDSRQRAVRRDLGDRYALHRTVMSAFPDAPGGRAELAVLFRLEADHPAPVLYVQSAVEPDWTALPDGYVQTDWLEGAAAAKPMTAALASLEAGRILRFRLHANPRKQVFVKGGRGPRVPLGSPADVQAWLDRQASTAGFAVQRNSAGEPDVALRPLDAVVGWQPQAGGQRRRITQGAMQFDGRLKVTDIDRFREALAQGIGGGRAFGLGLLSIAP